MVLVSDKPINPMVLTSLIAMAMHFLQAGRKHATLPGTEESMTTTTEFITALFCQVDDHLSAIPKHPEAHLWPSEVVTLGLLHALKGGGNRPFYRWLTRDYRPLFPRLPERTRLFRLFTTHQDWTQPFLASPTVLGVIDTYGIELIHPMREGRSPQQIGRKGLSNHRWIVGGELGLLLNQYGLVVAWACAAANVADNTFQWLIRQFEERMIILSDTGFHAAEGDPANLQLCQRGEWEDRMLVETVLSMLTLVCHLKKVMHRGWAYFQARLAFTMAAFNILVQWHGLRPYASRAWRCWGLCRNRHLLHLKVHVRIPALKNGAQLPVQRSYSRLQQQMRPFFGPLHLLLFTESFAHRFVHRRLHKPSRDRLSVAISLTVIRDQAPVVHDV